MPLLWKHRQLWRLFTWQICYVNSTELLFAAMTLYHLRVVERLWGPRKFTVRLSFRRSLYLDANTTCFAVIPPQRLPSNYPAAAHSTYHPPPADFRCNFSSSGRTYTPHLCPLGSILCRHPDDLQVPNCHLALLHQYRRTWACLERQILGLSFGWSIGPVLIPWLRLSGVCRVARGNGMERRMGPCCLGKMESARLGCGRKRSSRGGGV